MSRTLNLRGTFTEGESRNLNGRILRNTSNPNPPPRVVTSNDFDRYINILKANNRYPIPKEQTLSIYTTPHTIDKDIYLAKDSVISFFGTAPAYLNKFSLSYNNTVYDIASNFQYATNAISPTVNIQNDDYSVIMIFFTDNYYKIEYHVYRMNNHTLKINIPAYCYYYLKLHTEYPSDEVPALTFYEGDIPIISLGSPSNVEDNKISRIVTSSYITQFVLPSTS